MGLVLGFTAAHAHLMVAQKGTLNFSGDGAYLVLSLPVSSLAGVDDDGDQQLSQPELQAHAQSIEQQVQAGVQLLRDGQPLELQGLMLTLSPPDDRPQAPASQLVVMARFALGRGGELAAADALTFKISLFGQHPIEQAYDITFTRKPQTHSAHFTPSQTAQPVFPAHSRVFADHLRMGAAHVLGGLDHLLFLLVVLASLAGSAHVWRGALLTLSCFTAGHALTLAASVWGGVSVSSGLVEPAIAATIVGMAVFDLWQRHRQQRAPQSLHLALVFFCALIHGLGLAGALVGLGLTGASLAWSLAGFNLGIELGQLGVASVAIVGSALLSRLAGPSSRVRVAQAASLLGIGAGTWWCIARTAAGM